MAKSHQRHTFKSSWSLDAEDLVSPGVYSQEVPLSPLAFRIPLRVTFPLSPFALPGYFDPRIPFQDCAPFIYAPYIPLFVSHTINHADLLRMGKYPWRKYPLGRRDPLLGERTGARTYPILVSEVLAALKKGREEHKKLLKEAQAGYKKRVVEELEKALKEARAGTGFRTSIHLIVPCSYLKEYDNALALLEATRRAGTKKVELDAHEYEQFVRNIWSWTNQFRSSASAYVASLSTQDANEGLLPETDEED